jgi:hypothetical protein
MNSARHLAFGLALAFCVVNALAQQGPGGPGGPGGPPGAPMGPGSGGQPEANPPIIDSVSYAGNTKFSSAVLAQGSTIKPGVAVSRELVRGEIDRIVGVYKNAGYDLAISPDIQHPAAGHVAITFRIDESGKGGNAGPAPASPGAAGPGGAPPAGAPPPPK